MDAAVESNFSPFTSLTFKMAEDKPKAVALMSLNATKAGMQAVDKKTVRISFLFPIFVKSMSEEINFFEEN